MIEIYGFTVNQFNKLENAHSIMSKACEVARKIEALSKHAMDDGKKRLQITSYSKGKQVSIIFDDGHGLRREAIDLLSKEYDDLWKQATLLMEEVLKSNPTEE